MSTVSGTILKREPPFIVVTLTTVGDISMRRLTTQTSTCEAPCEGEDSLVSRHDGCADEVNAVGQGVTDIKVGGQDTGRLGAANLIA
jgi:hypothetical protein